MTSTLLDIAELRTRAADPGRARAGGRPATETLTLGADARELPTTDELAALLVAVPVAGVRLARPVDFATLPGEELVRTVALLRECAAVGVRVAWTLRLGADQLDLVPRLDHLPVPERILVPDQQIQGPWRSADMFGLFHFRRGPGFLSVVDNRPESRRRLVLDDPAVQQVFRRALPGCAWAELIADPDQAVAAAELVDLGMLLRIADYCVTLPVHLRSWPLGAALLGGTLAAAGTKPQEGNP
ncbi:DUF5825 family protein [Kitasatospora sp. LaBMicrA B282]|uniref:DUF5825 family protein n=1 Tax=Kitasatospora sp. LaBMicrA B282 TaxID=3420949 RepID=UPI003D0CDA02